MKRACGKKDNNRKINAKATICARGSQNDYKNSLFQGKFIQS
jgi:hypothetical protein